MELKRGIDPVLMAKLGDRAGFHPVVLISSVWPDGIVYAHSGNGNLTWAGQTWTGIANIASVNVGSESGGFVPSQAGMTITGALDTVLAYMDPAARGGAVAVHVGATTEPGGTILIGEPFQCFAGFLDENDMVFTAADGAAGLSVGVTSGPPARAAASISHSNEDQQSRYPGDTLFQRCAVAAAWRSRPIQFPSPT